MKIILIDPAMEMGYPLRQEPAFSLGLLGIGAVLSARGFEDIEYHNFYRKGWKDVRDILREKRPDVIGVSCTSNARAFAYRFSVLAKEIDPACRIVLGNIHASFFAEDILTRYPVDACVVGEGEETMLDYLETVRQGGDLEGVAGIVFKRDGRVIRTPKRELIKDLDTLPLAKEKRIYRNPFFGRPQASILTSRGCPFDCAFCSSGAFWGKGWRKRGPEKVVEELAFLVAAGAEYVSFMDDLFTLDQDRAIRICQLMIDRGVKVRWWANARVDTLSEELLDHMERAGCEGITCGVESGSPKILAGINKQISLDQTLETFRRVKKRHLRTCATFMVGNPGESEETIRETIRFIRMPDLDNVRLSPATIYPNTALYQTALEKGAITRDFWLSDKGLSPYYTADLTVSQIRAYCVRVLLSWLSSKSPLFFFRFALRNVKEFGVRRVVECFFSWLAGFFRAGVHECGPASGPRHN